MLNFYLARFINIFFSVLSFAILARVLLSWMPGLHHNRLVQLVREITEPVLSLARKITPKLGMLDLSPMVAILALEFLRSLILYFLNAV